MTIYEKINYLKTLHELLCIISNIPMTRESDHLHNLICEEIETIIKTKTYGSN